MTTASTTEKIAVVAPMPRVRTIRAAMVKPADDRSERHAVFRSSRIVHRATSLRGGKRPLEFVQPPVQKQPLVLFSGDDAGKLRLACPQRRFTEIQVGDLCLQ